jgi:hypothetical protein
MGCTICINVELATDPSGIINIMKPSSKKSATKTKKPVNKKLIILAFLLLVVLAGAFAFFRIQQNKAEEDRAFEADKARFAKVEADMAVAYASIQDKIGVPTEQSVDKNCSHTALKYAEGDLWCSIVYGFGYGAAGVQDIQNKASAIRETLVASRFQPSETSSEGISEINRNAFDQTVSYDLSNVDIESCKLGIRYGTNDELSRYRADGELAQYYEFRCEGRVKKAIYPLAE